MSYLTDAESLRSFKDGAELKEDGRVTVNRDFAPHGSYEVVIHKVCATDAGSYSATANNVSGADECSAAVTVKGWCKMPRNPRAAAPCVHSLD